jgi:hypothetical protein
MNFKKLFKQIGSVGSFAVATGIIGSIVSSEFVQPEAWFFLTVFLGLGSTGTYSLLQDAKKAQELVNLQQTKHLLRVVSSNFGKISFAELVMQMNTPIAELKAKLDEMQKDGLLGMEVSHAGEVLYTVSNPISLEDRLHAHKLLDER